MEIEGEGGELADHGRCKKRSRSPSLPGDGEDSPKSTTRGDGDEWLVSDSGSEEEDEDFEDQGAYPPFTSDNFPRASSDYDKQNAVLYGTPDIKHRGPSPIMLFPAFKTGRHLFASDYNLADKSEVTVSNNCDCPNKGRCYPMDLFQFVDAKIAGYQHTHPGHAKIFGFIAAREHTIKSLRNYVYRRNADNCEAVSVKRKTGVARLSLNSPAQAISLVDRVLIEFELHALGEDKIDGDDGLIIEGCTELYSRTSESFIQNQRLYGQRCALDIEYLVLINAVEARVVIEVIRAPAHGINLKLLAKTSGFSNVIRLFRGTVMEVGFSASFAVAVEGCSYLDLYIEGSHRDDPTPVRKTLQNELWHCRIGSRYHGVTDLVAELGDFAAVSVKISWKCRYRRAEDAAK